MGATFQAYRREYMSYTKDNIAYSAVGRFRGYLLTMLDERNGTDWYKRWHWCGYEDSEHGGNGEWDALLNEMRKKAFPYDGPVDDVVYGTLKFVNHSDRDGGWGSEACDAIAKAFSALLETDIVTDGYDRIRIQQMIDVFKDGAGEDCEVEII